MYYLDSFKNFKIYKNKIIYTFNKNDKKIKYNKLLIHIGINNNDIINFINNGLFKKEVYNSFYYPKLTKSLNKKKRKLVNQTRKYMEYKKLFNRKILMKNRIEDYKNRNLYIDLTDEIKLNQESYSSKTFLNSMKNFYNILNNTIKSYNYLEKVIVFNIDNISMEESENNFYNYFIKALIKKKYILDILKDYTILFYTSIDNSFIKITIDENIYKNRSIIVTRLKTLYNISNGIALSTEEEKEIDNKENNIQELRKDLSDDKSNNKNLKKEVLKTNIMNKIKKAFNIKDNNTSKYMKGLLDDTEDIIDRYIEDNENSEEKTDDELLEELGKDKEFVDSVTYIQQNKKLGRKKYDTTEMEQKQNEIVLNNISFKDLVDDYNKTSIDDFVINDDLIDDSLKTSTTYNFDKSYTEKQLNKDIATVLKAFNNDNDVKVFLTKAEVVKSSNTIDKKNTLVLEFQDEYKIKHNVKVDIPEVDQGQFMYIGGNKKTIMKQLLLKPIVKTAEDEVQITTNYNKLFVKRFGQKKSYKLLYLKKLFTGININSYILSPNIVKYKAGNNLKINSKYATNIEYNDISEYLLSLRINDITFLFNQDIFESYYNEESSLYKEKLASIKLTNQEYFKVGYYNNYSKLIICNKVSNKLAFIDKSGNIEEINETLSSYIIETMKEILDPEIEKKVPSTVKGSNLSYTRVEINNKNIPIIILLSYEEGLLNILERYKINYEFTTENKKYNINSDKDKIRFADGYLVYDTSKLRNSLLLSGLKVMDTENNNFVDFNEKDVYFDYFYDAFNSRNVGKGFHNTMSLLIDPITKEVLHDLGQPENVIDLFLYANTLLEDNTFSKLNDMNNYRLRGSEVIPAMLYKVLADSFKTYKDTSNAKNPTKMSVPQDILIKKLQELPNIEDYSQLNPTLELEKTTIATYRGLAGRNLADAYGKDIRSYDKSMSGILSITTPNNGNAGVNRTLAYNAKILNTRGYLDASGENDGNSNAYSIVELTNAFTANHADPPRIGMMVGQTNHVVPTKEQDIPLIGTGMERNLPYLISDDFAFKAKKDGIVEKIDPNNKLAFIKYNDGTKEVINLDKSVYKNGGGGFYCVQKYDILYKEGEKFKANTIIAKNSQFFSGNTKNDTISYTNGVLAKVSINQLDTTFEDSSQISRKLGEKIATRITMKEEVSLGKNSNILYIVQEDQKIKSGDPLIIFDESFEDESINTVLDKLGDEYKEEIEELSKNVKKSKYTGEIDKINVYYNYDISEYSESIQKFLKKFISKNKTKINLIEKNSDNEFNKTNLPKLDKVDGNKIKNRNIDGVLIEFYVTYYDVASVGDKISYYTSLKTIIADVFEDDEVPYSEYDKTEDIDATLSPLSINSRMTMDIFFSLYGNKALIELKKQVKKLFES